MPSNVEVVEVDSIGGDFGAVIATIADGLKARSLLGRSGHWSNRWRVNQAHGVEPSKANSASIMAHRQPSIPQVTGTFRGVSFKDRDRESRESQICFVRCQGVCDEWSASGLSTNKQRPHVSTAGLFMLVSSVGPGCRTLAHCFSVDVCVCASAQNSAELPGPVCLDSMVWQSDKKTMEKAVRRGIPCILQSLGSFHVV